MSVLEPIDWLTMQTAIAALAKAQREQRMQCERLAASVDKTVSQHREYWLALADRHGTMAVILDDLWQTHLEEGEP